MSAKKKSVIRISVVVPVKGDLTGLPALFEGLDHQTLPPNSYELVLVHNNFMALEVRTNTQFETISIAEPAGFSYSARNTGIKHSRGEIIAFTDADCIPHPRWLEAGLNCLGHGQDVFVAGSISVFPHSQTPTLVEKHQMTFAFDQEVNRTLGRGFPTANLFIRRKDFDQLGLFSAALESGGDAEWTRRAQDSGRKPVVCADALIFHPARQRLQDILSQRRRHARAISGFSERHDRKAFMRQWNNPRQFMCSRLKKNGNLSGPQRVAVAGLHVLLAVVQLTFTAVELTKQIFCGPRRQEELSISADR